MATITRRYGVVRDAGTSVTEELQPQSLVESPLGVVAWAGMLEKGPTDEIIEVLGPTQFARRCGGRIEDGTCPDNAQDFWTASRGAGRQYFYRVTDGTGRQSEITLKSRETSGKGYGRWRDVIKVQAQNVGRWGSAYNRRIGLVTGIGDVTATTIDTGLTLKEDEFKGGTIVLSENPTTSYDVTGNTVAGVVTVSSDNDVATDFGAAPTNLEFVLFKDNTNHLGNERKLAVVVKDGGRNPGTEFGMEFYWNGVKVLDYPNLSMDSDSDKYFENIINDDQSNYEVTVTNQLAGTEAQTAYLRPANQSGAVDTVSSADLTLEWYQSYLDSGNSGNATVGTVTAGANVQRDFITLECKDVVGPDWGVTSANTDRTYDDATEGAAYSWPNEYGVDFTISAGGDASVVGDKIYIVVEPLVEGEAVGGKVYPNMEDSPYVNYDIVSNTETTVSVRPNFDLSSITSSGKQYRIQYKQGLEKGYDGHAGVDDSDYIQTFDRVGSYFNQLKKKKLGLVKFAVPGVNSTAVQQAMRDYVQENGWMWRAEITKTITDEGDAIAYINDTLGRNDFMEVTFPSYYSKSDPDRTGYKELCLTGLIQGVEAAFARQYQGYHRVAAGVNAVLPRVKELPTGEVILDGEVLNPAGIQRVKKEGADWVLWGARIPSSATGLVWKHQREQLSHYVRVMLENFQWLIFTINDQDSDGDAIAALKAFFLPEWRPKRAIRGKRFKDAVTIQIDGENNTDATRQDGEKNCKITYQPADTTEQFNITISPLTGVTEAV